MNIFKNPIITNNKSLNEFIINRCNKDINEYNISLTSILKNLKKYYYYQDMFFFIIYKDGKLISLFNNGDTRKNKIFEIVKRNIKNLKNISNFFIPFYVADPYFYQNNDIPFFVEAKPGNKKGILYPDQNYYYISIENNDVTYDEFKSILKKNKCTDQKDKKNIIYFSGANTGADKHNIRMKLNEIINDEENDTIKNNYDINIDTNFVPMYNFCKFKYLLNLPGHQPWSYRMTKILLMNSLIFDVSVLQTYINDKNNIEDKNEKWIQFYSDYFKPSEDYVEIKYYWTEGLTSDMEVHNIYNELNKLYKYYNENNQEYKKITKNATKKANDLNNEIFDKTFQYLIELFIQKTYKDNNNNTNNINKFIDDLISLDKNFKVYNSNKLIKEIKIHDIYDDKFIKKIFLDNILNIKPSIKYNILTFGNYEKDKLNFIYNNIIKLNKSSHLTIINDDKNNDNKNDINKNNNYNDNDKNNINKNNINNHINYINNNNLDFLHNKYDIIFIFEQKDYKNLIKELILLWSIVKFGGYLIIDLYNSNNNKEIYYSLKTFKELFKYDILYLKNIGKRVVINKINKIELTLSIPQKIITIINKYINDFRKDIYIKLPSQKKEVIKWKITTSSNEPKNEVKYGYVKNFEKSYKKYFMMTKNDNFNRFRFDLDYIGINRINSYEEYFFNFLLENYNKIFSNNDLLEQKITILQNIFKLNKNINKHIEEYFKYLIQRCELKNNSLVKVFEINSYLYPDSLTLNKFSKIKSNIKLKININHPIRSNLYKNNLNSITKNSLQKYNINRKKIDFKYLLLDNDLFNFNSIIKFAKSYNNNINFIHLKLGYMLTKYKFEEIHNNMYLWLNMLYLILKMQSNKGTLILSNIVFANKPYLDFIYILNNYYDKVVLTNFNEVRGITICCYGFRGITKNEFNNFYNEYYQIYNKNYNKKFINNLILNKIDKSIIKSYKEYNSYFMKNLIFITDYNEKINDLFNKSNDDIKRYIFGTIFEQQYIRYNNYTSYLDVQMNKFYNVCGKNSI